MTVEERQLIDYLLSVIYKANKNKKDKEDKRTTAKNYFLSKFTTDITQHPEYLKQLFEVAYIEKANRDVEKLITLTGIFGLYTEDLVDILIKIILEPWHYWHETIASIFEQLKSPRTVDALFKAATAKYEYMPFDGGIRPLIVQCIWSLGAINTPEAREKIIKIAELIDDSIVKERAEMQLRGDRGPML